MNPSCSGAKLECTFSSHPMSSPVIACPPSAMTPVCPKLRLLTAQPPASHKGQPPFPIPSPWMASSASQLVSPVLALETHIRDKQAVISLWAYNHLSGILDASPQGICASSCKNQVLLRSTIGRSHTVASETFLRLRSPCLPSARPLTPSRLHFCRWRSLNHCGLRGSCVLVCLVTMCTTHMPKEPGFHTLSAVLGFRAPCCAGERSVYASGLGMWLQEGRDGQVSGAVGGTSLVEAGGLFLGLPWLLTCEGHLVPDSEGEAVLFATYATWQCLSLEFVQ